MTLFRVNSEQLKVAAGRVRCCQCQRIFNALESLQEDSSPNNFFREQPDQAIDEELAAWSPLVEADDLTSDTLNLDWNQRYNISDLEEGLEDSDLRPFLEQDNGLETEPDYFASGGESQISSLLDSDSSPLLSLVEAPNEDTNPEPEPALPHQLSKQIPSTETSERPIPDIGYEETFQDSLQPKRPHLSSFTAKLKDTADERETLEPTNHYTIDQMFEKEPANYGSILWGLASLVLASALILQLAWHYRDQVIHKAVGRQLLTQMCAILDCKVPVRRDTSKILVEYRDLRADPARANALLLQLTMVNRASFEQPYPKLHLSLFNDEERLIAERTFLPREYLSGEYNSASLMPRSSSLQIKLELVDPGKDVTGFKFEFL